MSNKTTRYIISILLGICIVGLFAAIAWRLVMSVKGAPTKQDFSEPGVDNKKTTIPGRPHHIPTEVSSPDKIKRRISFNFSTNSHGLRGKEFAVEKAKDTYRIIIVGECVAFGVGVNDNETYAVLLEQILTTKHPGKKFEVLNAGTIADSADRILRLLKKVSNYKPDLVLFAPGSETVFLPCHVGREKTRIWLKQEEYDRHMVNFRRVLNDSIAIASKNNFHLIWITPTINSFFLPDGRLWIQEMRVLARKTGTALVDTAALFLRKEKENGLVFVSRNGKHQLIQNKDGKETVLKEVPAPDKDNTHYIAPEIYAYLDSHTNVSPLLSIDGNHPNPRGHALIAREILRVLGSRKYW